MHNLKPDGRKPNDVEQAEHDSALIEVTRDGSTTMPMLVHDSRQTGWAEPIDLAREVAESGAPLLRGEDFVVAEEGPAGVRLHQARVRKTDKVLAVKPLGVSAPGALGLQQQGAGVDHRLRDAMLVLGLIPLLLVGALLAWAFVALLRRSEGGLELFADAVWTWAGSVVGIWLGMAIVGSVLGVIGSAAIFAVVLGTAHLLVPDAPWVLKLLFAALSSAIVFVLILWRFLSLSFLRR